MRPTLMLKNKNRDIASRRQSSGPRRRRKDRDAFQAFLKSPIRRRGGFVRFTENEVGVRGKFQPLIVEEDLNISSHTVNIPRSDGKVAYKLMKNRFDCIKGKLERRN